MIFRRARMCVTRWTFLNLRRKTFVSNLVSSRKGHRPSTVDASSEFSGHFTTYIKLIIDENKIIYYFHVHLAHTQVYFSNSLSSFCRSSFVNMVGVYHTCTHILTLAHTNIYAYGFCRRQIVYNRLEFIFQNVR